tara:strand:- start:1055 stop:1504 length:450 start_codon:yes stop_codon:yes gene_type:complete
VKINKQGLEIIKSFEGWSAEPYLCPANRWTIAYGSTWDIDGHPLTADHPNITKDQGEALLRKEVHHIENAVKRLIKTPLTINQFSAVCSWGFNIGSGNVQNSTLRMLLNRQNYEGAADEFPKWRKAGGRVLKGLVRRRVAERILFLTPN